jgi:hypothetical protein
MLTIALCLEAVDAGHRVSSVGDLADAYGRAERGELD